MEALVALLKQHTLCIGSCESLTAGLFASSLAEVPGASAVLKGAIVTYQTSCKIDVVHVDADVITQYGVISIETAKEMATKARQLLQVDICVSFTGNAGPDTMEGKPAGYVCCAVAFAHDVKTYEFQLDGSRNEIRKIVVEAMCKEIKKIIERTFMEEK